MKYLLIILWFIIFTKLFVFWLWLWQLKEYHWKRFLAHFETQALRKFLFSFSWRIQDFKYPKFTQKAKVILVIGIIWESIFVSRNLDISNLIFSIILAPVTVSFMVLLFQIPTSILIKRELEKAKIKREGMKNLLVIGIAGSYGKTAVKEFLFEILSDKFKTLKTEKNNNAEISIARLILDKLDSSHQVLIAEIGAYEKGKIRQVCNVIKPKIGILTGINEQHLSTFGSQENIIQAKNEILEYPEIKIRYDDLKIFATDIVSEKESLSFKINEVDFKVNLRRKHNIKNLLLAISCALKVGMTLEEISRACLKIKISHASIEVIEKENYTILDTSYSANSTGVLADLNYLNTFSTKKIIVMPCLIELGSSAKSVHEKIGKRIDEVCDLGIITTKDYFQELKQNNEKILLIENSQKIIKEIKKYPNSTILLEGRIPSAVKKDLCQ
ncbi:hypothetical protein KKA24_02565 [Patescibacteria group bacterium]|nr:hypothetical protein [Patescibacteria group bacterium]